MFVRFDLPLRRTCYPLGLPLEVQTNSSEVVEAASETWGAFPQSFDMPPMSLSLGVSEQMSEAPLPSKSNFRARGHMMAIVTNAENFVVCDFHQAFSYGWITPAMARDHAALRYHVLTPAATMMAQHRALAPVHGALIARNGRGVALCGDSFAGKSTLAYACARVGWTFICDDGTFLVRDREDRYAVGDPNVIRFRDDARQLFPELAERLLITRPNGKIGLELFTRDLPFKKSFGCNIDHVIFLNRHQRGNARLRTFPQDQLDAWLERYVNFGTPEVQAAQKRCQQRLRDAGVWEMSYGNLDDAVQRLEQLVDSGA